MCVDLGADSENKSTVSSESDGIKYFSGLAYTLPLANLVYQASCLGRKSCAIKAGQGPVEFVQDAQVGLINGVSPGQQPFRQLHFERIVDIDQRSVDY